MRLMTQADDNVLSDMLSLQCECDRMVQNVKDLNNSPCTQIVVGHELCATVFHYSCVRTFIQCLGLLILSSVPIRDYYLPATNVHVDKVTSV